MDHVADNCFLNEEILVVFDIDNTLGENCHELGGYQWYLSMVAQKMNEGLSEDEAAKAVFIIINRIMHLTSMRTLEPCTPTIVKELQTLGVKTLAATGRTHVLIPATAKHFLDIGVDFSNIWSNTLSHFELGLNWPVHFSNGVLFCGPNKKGKAIIHFLNHHAFKPKKIIFIDDLEHYVHEFDHTMQEHGIECIALHYTLIDQVKSSFDPVQSEIMLQRMLAQTEIKENVEKLAWG